MYLMDAGRRISEAVLQKLRIPPYCRRILELKHDEIKLKYSHDDAIDALKYLAKAYLKKMEQE